jgi:uncharacterized integral membrane protein
MKKIAILILAVILLLIVATVTGQNSGEVLVNLLLWETSSSLAIILFCAFSLGILAAIFTLLPRIIHLRQSLKYEQENRKLMLLEKEKQALHKQRDYIVGIKGQLTDENK